ncbi:hypothetical protein CORC01_04498 [Colletotrichum orchidophilum]|uniref:Uncharacterized protein n=1 Tax=Colletotrichum orchidophilum TaxID=1209926 RepID=A0A1G4BF35_9PEZI|nr:uncharacterized protein CORC01_04498 [Colletotrichum orchidophilum]OHF00090.1 hypothetical protein CORC01_04498 [Colletotrichum orchidophilum]
MEKDSWHRASDAWGPPTLLGNSGELLAVPSKGVQRDAANETRASEQVKQNPK